MEDVRKVLNEKYLDGYVYHMTHFENLRDILKSSALLSQQELDKKGIRSRSIANQEVQNLRRRIYVWSIPEKRYRPLHSYVPFYFTPYTPMFRNQRDIGIHNDIIIFEVSRAFIGSIDQSVIFTDGNASNQQLSKSAGEKVQIVPGTASSNICRRRYFPDDQPLGTNTNRSDFYADTALLDHVNWDVINGRFFVEDKEEYKRLKHAEVLVPDRFPLDEMLTICVSTEIMVARVKKVFAELGLTEQSFDLPVVHKPNLFV
ncbi:MAG: DUF4433 domain-containing protein [Ktedonobacteraceae bacterium]